MQIGAAYIRVSTDDQTEYSPEAQLHALREYSKRNDILLTDDFIFRDEGISGRKASKRPGFQEMISTAKKKPKPFDVILVHKFDRFARNREDSVVYKSLLRRECDIRVVSITEQLEDDKFSVILESMLEAMAEYYSLNLADEVKKGLFEKARRGENIGKSPFGYDLINSKLVPNPKEAETVKTIFQMYQTESLSGITKYLNENCIHTKTGGNWTPLTLIYILENPVYYGVMRYNYRKGGLRNATNPKSEWILAESAHTPLVNKELYDSTQVKIDLSANLHGRNFKSGSLKSWLQHISKCEHCGSTLTVSTTSKQQYAAFRCSRANIGACQTKTTLSSKKLEAMALKKMRSDYLNPNQLTIHKIEPKTSHNIEDELTKKLKRIENKYELIKKAYLSEVDTLDEYKTNKEQLKKEEEAIRKELSSLAQPPIETPVLKLDSFLDLLSDTTASSEERNKIAKSFIKEVRVDLKTKEIGIIYYI